MAISPSSPHIVIVGGGLAGLAVASSLVNRGLRLTLLESRPRLGGRASSFQDPVTNELVDNCQHVSMGCCTNLAKFCRSVGIDAYFRRERELVVLDRGGRVSRFRAGFLPAPFHLTGSFLRARFLGVAEKIRLAYGLGWLVGFRDERPGESFESWLVRHGQTRRVIELFWETVLVSALNERIGELDVSYARKVFLDGFFRNRDGFQLELPLVPLGELYGTRLESWLRERGVTVILKAGVRTIECDDDDGSACGVVLRSGESIAADFVVLAVPFDKVGSLIPEPMRGRLPALKGLDLLRSSPITGVHLWFDRPVCPFDHVVTPGRLIQWVFNHTAIQGRGLAAPGLRAGGAEGQDAVGPDGEGQYLQLVVSASRELASMDKDAIRDAVLADLAEIWPAVKSARLLKSWIVVEHGATFSARPGVDALRPSQKTPVDALMFAGDWTRTRWPATMEGAVRSGYLAAEEILRTLDRPARLVQPELKSGWLARWLFGEAAALSFERCGGEAFAGDDGGLAGESVGRSIAAGAALRT